MRTKYRTVKGYGESMLEITKSRFYAYANRAETEADALAFIATIKKRHPDANHNCSAYIAGVQDEFQKADDDGEPSGTAGKPILEVLKKSNIKDTVLVVTRYFGGIKLGAGGLIRAYGKSATAGLQAAGRIERILHSQMGIDIDYSQLGMMENQLRSRNYTITDKQFSQVIRLFVLAETGQEEELRQLATEWTAGTAVFSDQGQAYVDIAEPAQASD